VLESPFLIVLRVCTRAHRASTTDGEGSPRIAHRNAAEGWCRVGTGAVRLCGGRPSVAWLDEHEGAGLSPSGDSDESNIGACDEILCRARPATVDIGDVGWAYAGVSVRNGMSSVFRHPAACRCRASAQTVVSSVAPHLIGCTAGPVAGAHA
jgi:hypothetical protein